MSDPLLDCRACTCLALRRLSREVTAHYERAFRGTGLRATQFTLLSMLAQAGPVPLTRLAELLGMDRTTLNRNLAPLEERALLATERGEDPRVREVRITSEGRQLAEALLPRWRDAQDSVAPLIARQSVLTYQGATA